MPNWSKAVLRTIGALDAVLTALGTYFLVSSVWGGVFSLETRPDTPYFKIAFEVMTAVNAGFLLLFALAALQLLRLKRSGVIVHAISSVLLIAYYELVGMLWRASGGIGMSIAAATGVGNMGIAPFVVLFVIPNAYPITSTLVLLVTRWKMTANPVTSDGTAEV